MYLLSQSAKAGHYITVVVFEEKSLPVLWTIASNATVAYILGEKHVLVRIIFIYLR